MSETLQSTYSIEQLERITADPKQIIEQLPALVSSLSSGDDEANACVIDAIRELKTIGIATANKLVPLCNSNAPQVAAWACKLLAQCDAPTEAIEDHITTVLTSHSSTAAKQEAVVALGKLKQINEHTRLALQQASQSADARLSRLATQLLAQ